MNPSQASSPINEYEGNILPGEQSEDTVSPGQSAAADVALAFIERFWNQGDASGAGWRTITTTMPTNRAMPKGCSAWRKGCGRLFPIRDRRSRASRPSAIASSSGFG
ncbi:hypothetical protein COHCIP112018_03334 [Cohnella sp. JJ-181]|nr:hypothetical protein COHCIP112018_03334 [Cohnella sp. JJ-181]